MKYATELMTRIIRQICGCQSSEQICGCRNKQMNSSISSFLSQQHTQLTRIMYLLRVQETQDCVQGYFECVLEKPI